MDVDLRNHWRLMWGMMAAMGVAWVAQAAEPAATRPAEAVGATLVPVPADMGKDAPLPRTRAELTPLLAKPRDARATARYRPLHVVLVAGPKDHGPGEHDYPAWQKAWQKLLAAAPQTKVTTAWETPSDDDFKSADVLVIFKHKAWPRELNEQIDAFLARGGGIVLLHYAVDGADNAEHVGKCLGLCWRPSGKYRHGHLDLEFPDQSNVPFLRGLAGRKLHFHDETYWRLAGDPAGIEVLATGMEDDGDGKMVRIPLIWNRQVGKGRVHVNILGHYNWTFNDPLFRVLVLRGIAWAAGVRVDRFNDLATVDVAIKE